MTDKQAPALHEASCERAVRDLELLERIRTCIEVQRVLTELSNARDNSAYQAEHAQKHLRSEYKRRSEFYAAMVELLGGEP
jgi:hypothetical protein